MKENVVVYSFYDCNREEISLTPQMNFGEKWHKKAGTQIAG